MAIKVSFVFYYDLIPVSSRRTSYVSDMIPEILLPVPDMTLKKQSLLQVAGIRKQM